MQARPAATDLLEAISDLLIKEIMPEVKDNDELAYKTLVSWNMLGIIVRELKTGEAGLDDELRSLSGLLEQESPDVQGYLNKYEAAHKLNHELNDKIKAEKIGPENKEIWQHLKKTLAADLSIANPRFKTD